MNMLKKFLNGLLAGLLITIAAKVYIEVSSYTSNPLCKCLAAFLFSIALVVICLRGYNLYTGKIGLMVDNTDKDKYYELSLGLLGNIVGVLLFGTMLSFYTKNETLINLYNAKINQNVIETLIKAFFCGVLMYLAVVIYKNNNKLVGILFAIPVFILAGFNHCIADLAYISFTRLYNFKAILYFLLCVVGNTLGSLLIAYIEKLTKKQKSDIE